MTKFEKLRKAYQLIETGNRVAARALLLEVIEQEPGEAEAWVGLAFCSTVPSERKRCLERALWANPDHRYAREALDRLANETAQAKSAGASLGDGFAPAAGASGQGWGLKQVNLALAAVAFVVVGLVFIVALTQNAFSTSADQVALANGGQYQFIEFYADW